MFLLSLSVLYLIFNVLNCMEIGPIKSIQVGQQLVDALISRQSFVDFITCVKHCVRMRSCRSVNYMEKFLLCELNYKNTANEDANITLTPGVVYSERIHWNEDTLLSKSCREKSCSDNTECIEDINDQPLCVVSDCRLPNEMEHGKYDAKNGIGVYSKVTYECEKDYTMEGKSMIGCQDDGQWSPARFECVQVCDTGWKHYQHSCYKMPQFTHSFKEAMIYCEEEYAYLADVLSEEENDFILKLTDGRYPGYWVLLGGKYNTHTQQWKWIHSDLTFHGSGAESMLYTNWDNNEPSVLLTELCMGMIMNKWHDWPCDQEVFFVCKKNARA